MNVVVVLLDARPTGLAELLAGLLESNLARHPQRAALLRPAVIEVSAADAGVVVTVRVRRGRIEISGDARTARPDLRIRADGRDLLALSDVPLRLGFPDALHPGGRAVLRRIVGRHVRISGMFRHPAVLSRFARLLSAR